MPYRLIIRYLLALGRWGWGGIAGSPESCFMILLFGVGVSFRLVCMLIDAVALQRSRLSSRLCGMLLLRRGTWGIRIGL